MVIGIFVDNVTAAVDKKHIAFDKIKPTEKHLIQMVIFKAKNAAKAILLRGFSTQKGKKASDFAGMYLGNTPFRVVNSRELGFKLLL